MAIKHIAVRTSDGHAFDPTRDGCKFKTGLSALVEVLTTGKTDRVRVSCDGDELKGTPPRWPAGKPVGTHKVLIEQLVGDAVVDKKEGTIEIIGETTAEAPAAPARQANKTPTASGVPASAAKPVSD